MESELKIQKDSKIPKYLQVIDSLKAAIRQGLRQPSSAHRQPSSAHRQLPTQNSDLAAKTVSYSFPDPGY